MALIVDSKEVSYGSIEIDGINRRDYPDFCDAFFAAAQFVDGTPLNDAQLEELNDKYIHETNSIIHDRVLYI